VPAELRAGFALAPPDFVALVVDGLRSGTFRWAHRAVLLNTIAEMPDSFLAPTIAALQAARSEAPDAPAGLWESLLELATVRLALLAELEPPDA
jgi:hypothetical protein